MTYAEIEAQAKERASDCADAIQCQYGLADKQRVGIERMLKREFIDAMREARDA